MNPVSASSAIQKIGQAQDAIKSQSPGASKGAVGEGAVGKGSFGDLVNNFIEQTNNAQINSDVTIQDFASGKTDNVQQVVMAMANADMSFQLFMEIRNKLIDSYTELMRMQF
jgi:flagellar hook-basal body complex protein FliE